GALATTDANAGIAQLVPVLQGLIGVLTSLVGLLQAQYGAGAIAGGVAPTVAAPVAPVAAPIAAPVAPVTAPIAAPVVTPVEPVITSGGGGALAAPAAPTSTEPQGIPAVFDTRRLFGTPTPGGTIDSVVKGASTTSPMAMSEGAWTWMQDSGGSGAQLQLHLHGKWATDQTGLKAALANGSATVHLHPDGTLHVHDIVK
ncbi:MAG: hypothetical protein H7123_03565, partial [Thermoleophilia bacterium]|nr:hypothetical protein [Thermoleophilia bacterium]